MAKVDTSSAVEVEPKTVFVISPIGEEGMPAHVDARNVLEYIIRKALPAPQYRVVRADEAATPDSISQEIVRQIVESDFIVADLTDRNANVFYELAVAHGFERPVVHLMTDTQTPPFDLADQRVIFYKLTDPASVDKAKDDLVRAIAALVASSQPPRNPVTAFRNFVPIERSATPIEANEALAETLSQILVRLSRIESQQRSGITIARRTDDSPRTASQQLAIELAYRSNEKDRRRRVTEALSPTERATAGLPLDGDAPNGGI